MKKIISYALALVMCVGIFPTTASAAKETVWVPVQGGETVTGYVCYDDPIHYVIVVNGGTGVVLDFEFDGWVDLNIMMQNQGGAMVLPTDVITSGAYGIQDDGRVSFLADQVRLSYPVQPGEYYITILDSLPSINVSTVQMTVSGDLAQAAPNPLIVNDGKNYDYLSIYEDGSGFTGYYQVEKDGKYGLLDSNGNEVVPPQYDWLGDIADGMIKVRNSVGGTNKYGFVDLSTGKLAIPLEYDDQAWEDQSRGISDFSNGVAVVSEAYRYNIEGSSFQGLGVRYGLIDKTGKMVIPMGQYDTFAASTDWLDQWATSVGWALGGGATYSFADNRVVVKDSNRWKVLDTKGTMLFELPNYDDVSGYVNGYAIITQYGTHGSIKHGFIDINGNVVIAPQYDSVAEFHNGYAKVGILTDNAYGGMLYGLIDQQGKLVVPMVYEGIYTFYEGMALVMIRDRSGAFKYGFVDLSGQLVIPCIYDRALHFHDGLASVGILNDQLSEPDNLVNVYMCGYIDKQGKQVIPLEYNYASSFKNGVAVVESGTRNGTEISLFSPYFSNPDEYWSKKFQDFGIQSEYRYIDTSGKVLASSSMAYYEQSHGNDRLYIDQINGKYALLRNPYYRETATPTRSTVLVDGQNVAFDAYNINGNNYFKLRDLAKVLSGTGKQFEVTWDGKNNAIDLLSGQPYTTVGGELAQGDGADKTAQISTSTIYLNGQPISLTAYTINNNNYFKLRDVGQTFDFNVTWDGARNTIVIDTTQSYTPD